jgi:hypothetical protein
MMAAVPPGDFRWRQEVKTELREGGLRYVSKTTGSDFPGAFGATMSCLRCGRHMPRSQLRSFLLAGSRQFRCREGCAPQERPAEIVPDAG